MIWQISKEFDLLRFSKSEILNVEFKSRPIPMQKIEKQLIQNKNYLNSLPFNQIASFSYVVDGETSHLYKLSEDNKLVVSTPVELKCPTIVRQISLTIVGLFL